MPAREARLNELLDLVEQARAEGDTATEAKAIQAYHNEKAFDEPGKGPDNGRHYVTNDEKLGQKYDNMSLGEKFVNDAKSAGKGLVGIGESALSGLSNILVGGVATPIADLLARTSGHDPAKAKEWVDKELVMRPQTTAGQDIAAGAGEVGNAAVAPVGMAVNKTDQFIGDQFGPGVQQGVRDTAAIAGDLVSLAPGAGAVVQGVKRMGEAAAAKTAGAAVARAPDEVARAAGYRVGPTDVKDATGVAQQPSMAATALESVSNRHSSLVDNIRHNKANTNDIAAQDIGLPAKTPLTPDNLAKARAPHAKVYDEIRKNIPAAPLDKQFAQDVAGAGRSNGSVRALPPIAQKEIDDLLSQGSMSGTSMLGTISDLRRKGWKATSSENPDLVAVGDVQLDLANALEAQLDRAASKVDPTLGDRYRSARKGFAKIETVERVLKGQDVDPQMLRRAAAKTDAIDGGLAIIADTAESFPKTMVRDIPEASNRVGGNDITGLLSNAAGSFGGRALLRNTRGEARTPQLGANGPLSYYYREPNKPKPGAPVQEDNLAMLRSGPAGKSAPGEAVPANIMGTPTASSGMESILRGGPGNKTTPGATVPPSIMGAPAAPPSLSGMESILRGGPANKAKPGQAVPASLSNEPAMPPVTAEEAVKDYMLARETLEQRRLRLLAESLRK